MTVQRTARLTAFTCFLFFGLCGARQSVATVDFSGPWFVQEEDDFVHLRFTTLWNFVQTGSTITFGDRTGTVDQTTGVAFFPAPGPPCTFDECFGLEPPSPSCNPPADCLCPQTFPLTLHAAPDGRTFT